MRFLEAVQGIEKVSIWVADVGFAGLEELGASGSQTIDATLADVLMGGTVVDVDGGAQVPLAAGGLVVGLLLIKGNISGDLRVELPRVAAVIADRIISLKSFSDVIERERCAGELGLAATIQYELMPRPGYQDETIEIGGRIEPALDIAGDGFDYAVNSGECHFGVFDAVGHGLCSTMLTTVAIGAYRLQRRRRASLGVIADEVERAVAGVARDGEFVTGLLCRSDLAGSAPGVERRTPHASRNGPQRRC